LAKLNAIVSDATLDDASSQRPPASHASSHEAGGGDALTALDASVLTSGELPEDRLPQALQWLLPTWEWNETDLSQFSAEEKSSGTVVTASSWSVVSWLGLSWIECSVTASWTSGKVTMDYFTVRPIDFTPSSADYLLAFDWVTIAAPGGNVGLGAAVRYQSIDSMYLARALYAADRECRLQKVTSGSGSNLPAAIKRADPDVTVPNGGGHLSVAVEGQSLLSVGRLLPGVDRTIHADTSSPITPAGKAAIGISTNAYSGGPWTMTARIRNIRIYEL